MELHLKTPLTREQTSSLRVGDTIFLSGPLITARDEAHKILLDEGLPSDVMLDGGVVYHSGLLTRGKDYDIISAGPTTSMRMESFTPQLLDRFGVKLLIGKGGMGTATAEALKEHGAVYASFLGGGGALGAERLKVKDVFFLERLGMAEAVWSLEAEEFGPLVVTMDSHGNSLYEKVRARAKDRMIGLL